MVAVSASLLIPSPPARAARPGIMSEPLRRRLEQQAARGEAAPPLLVRLRDRGLAAAAPLASGESWASLSAEARTDLRRRSSARLAAPFLAGAGGGRHLWIANAVRLQMPAQEALALAEGGEVEAILEDLEVRCLPEPAALGTPGSPAAGGAAPGWGLDHAGATRVQRQLGLDGEGVRLGHIDTGADGAHPALAGRIERFRDFTAGRREAYDDHGHGTHTLGIMLGGARGTSAAPAARALVARALDGHGSGKLSNLLEALQWMADPDGDPGTPDQPLAVNASWGIPRKQLQDAGAGDTLFWDAVQGLRDAGVLPIFAAGNDGAGAEVVPGGYPHVLAVGAVDERDQVPSFSTGLWIDWSGERHLRPDLVAPGVAIQSLAPGGGHRSLRGTSQAAPHVAGLAALVKQAAPALRALEIEQILLETAREAGAPGPDARYGRGILDGYRAVLRARGQEPPPVATPPPTPTPVVTPRPPPPRPLPPQARRRLRGKVAGFALGLAMALGLGLLFMRGG